MEESSSNKKKYIILFFVFIILISSLAFYFLYYKKISVSYEFDGRYKNLNGQTVTVEGTFIYTKNPKPAGPLSSKNVIVTKDTVINKVIIHLPTKDELKDTDGYFDGSSLKRDRLTSDLETFSKDLSNVKTGANIFAKSNKNIYNKSSFEAIEITYEIAI